MKKILLLVVMLGIITSAHSQFITQGSIVGNGSFWMYSTKFKESKDKYSGFEIMPWAGYFVMDNFAVGAMIDYDHDVVDYDASNYKTKNNTILFGPVVRYYLNNGFFAHGDLGFGKTKSKTDYSGSPDIESDFSATQLRIGIGYAFRITDTVFFDPIVGLKSNKEKYDSGDDTETGIFAMGSFTIKIK